FKELLNLLDIGWHDFLFEIVIRRFGYFLYGNSVPASSNFACSQEEDRKLGKLGQRFRSRVKSGFLLQKMRPILVCYMLRGALICHHGNNPLLFDSLDKCR